jgi:predicted nucleotidyltransferase
MARSSQTIWRGKTLDEIRQILRQMMPDLAKRYSVKSLGIFGSYVRGEARSTSDLDILVEFDRAPTLLEFIQLESDLSEQLGVKVDLVMKKALKPNIGRYVLEEVVAV